MRTGRDYAVKIVKIVNPEDAGFIELLRTEHAIGTAIDHPIMRKVYELRMLRRRLKVYGAILFMEYVPGISLADKEFSAPLDDILRIFSETAEGLHAMHLGEYVHADLKPNNIMLTDGGKVKLIDLGQSSKIREAKPRIQGSIDYMAPEQVRRDKLDERTDVFGIGSTLHRVLTGRAISTKMNQTINMQAQSLVGRRVADRGEFATEELPPALARLIEDCCHIDPDDRIKNMTLLIERIDLVRMTLAKARAEVHSDRDASDAPKNDQDVPGDDDES